jgi:hypothetical protein
MQQSTDRSVSSRRGARTLRRHQRGITFIGVLIIFGLVGMIGFAGLRLAPVYLNYMKVARSMDVTAQEFKGENPDPGGVRRSLEKHWQIEDIDEVSAKDVEIVKGDDGMSLHVTYDHAVPYISNVSLSVHFDKTVKVQ